MDYVQTTYPGASDLSLLDSLCEEQYMLNNYILTMF